MRRINKNTLIEISNLTSPVMKLAKFLQESNAPFYVNSLNNIESTSLVNDYILAFDKDINETVNLLTNLATVWHTADHNGIAHELTGEEKNLKKLFNIEGNYIAIFGGLFSLNSEKEELKTMLLSNILNISEDEYKVILKKARTNSTEESFLNEDATEDEKFLYLIRKSEEDTSKLLAQHISKVLGSYIEFRNDLTIEEKSIIDDKITFSRTMADGVLDTSTYITEQGIENVSNKHKKDISYQRKLEKVETLIKESKIFYGAEIDQDTSLDKIINVLEQCKNLKLNTNQKFIFKARKLGNYNANGIYFDGFKIVSVDINSPSALIHELSHAVDFNNDHVSKDSRVGFVNIMRNLLSEQYCIGYNEKLKRKEYLYPNNYGYLSSSVEIIARAGELGYLLQKYDYQGHSNDKEFYDWANNVRRKQKEEHIVNDEVKNILICKPIDTYMARPDYFGFNETMPKEVLMLIKDYYKGYYNSLNNDLKPLPFDRIKELQELMEYKRAREKEKKTKNNWNREENPISFLNIKNIDKVVSYNESEQIFSNKELVEYMFKNFANFNRTRKVENDDHCMDRITDFISISNMTNKFPAEFNKYLKDMYYYSAFKKDEIRSSITIAKPVLTALELKDDFSFIQSSAQTLGHVSGTTTRIFRSDFNKFACALGYLNMSKDSNIKYNHEEHGGLFRFFRTNEVEVAKEISLGQIKPDSIISKDSNFDHYMKKIEKMLNEMKHDEIHKTIFLYGQILDSLKTYTHEFKDQFITQDIQELKSQQVIDYQPKKEHFFDHIETTLKCYSLDFHPKSREKIEINENSDIRLRQHDKYSESTNLRQFRENQIYDFEWRSKYNKRPQFGFEITDFKDSGKIAIFDRIFKEIKNNPDHVFKNKTANSYGALVPAKLMKKVLANECTDSDKLSYMEKLNFASLNRDLLMNIMKDYLKAEYYTQEKTIDIVTYDRSSSSSYYTRDTDNQLMKMVPLAILKKHQEAFFNGTYEYDPQEVKELVNKMVLEINVNSLSQAVTNLKSQNQESNSEELEIKFKEVSQFIFENILKKANLIISQKGLGEVTFNTIIDLANNVSTDAFAIEKSKQDSELFLYPILLTAKGSGITIDVNALKKDDQEVMKKLGLIEEKNQQDRVKKLTM